MHRQIAGIFLGIIIFLGLPLQGQKSCGSVSYQQQLQEKFPLLENSQQFELWMQEKTLQQQTLPSKLLQKYQLNEVVTIPVVVHIIHNGEPLGSGTNLDDGRIFQQIQTLNEDFRRGNADTVNTPGEFKAVAADPEVEFVLALRDPEGLPTSGIQRVQGTRSLWSMVHNTELKALSYWPAEDYLNIWVAPLQGSLGYAQFPVSNLEGLDIASENRLTDGVVLDSDFLGNNDTSTPISRGRTGTHEVGHFLGLRHIWGDGGCNVDDFCGDTPLASSSHFGCPDSNSCGSDDMVENYMDLTDDLCMNLFTLCQKSRMQVVLDNSPRRLSLLSSNALQPPLQVTNDAGIKEISAPQARSCVSEVTPQAVIRNYGTNTVTSMQVQLFINGTLTETQTISQTLAPLETAQISFSNQTIMGQTEVLFKIVQTNGGADNNDQNDEKNLIISEKAFSNLPISQGFAQFPFDWEIQNDDNSTTWEVVSAVLEEPGNTAVHMNFFDYDNADGEYDYLITPSLDLSNFSLVSLEFKMAYAPYSSNSRDGLIVALSTDCGNSYLPQDYLFRQEGLELATVPITNSFFVPANRNDWRTVEINLDQYAGSSQVKIAFIGINDFGNNLYLDDVEILGSLKPDVDLELLAVIEPALVSCQENVAPQVVVRNSGIDDVNSFQLSYQLGNGLTDTLTLENLMLGAGQQATISFPGIALSGGADILNANLEMVNGNGSDGNSANNSLQQPFIIDHGSDIIPIYQPFESPLSQTDWQQLGFDTDISWEVIPIPGLQGTTNQAVYMNFFNYSQKGALDYLVSPTLDFSQAPKPTMTFDLAYGGGDNFSDGLMILLSTDCGFNYTDTLFDLAGKVLATTIQGQEFFPNESSDWKQITIDLGAYSGLSDVRIAFVGVNDFGNNLYLDNIEFFTNENTTSLGLDDDVMIIFPNPAQEEFQVTFNLSTRQNVSLRILDPMGQVILNKTLQNVLNQTFMVDLPHSAGVYILQATGMEFKGTRRIIMTR